MPTFFMVNIFYLFNLLPCINNSAKNRGTTQLAQAINIQISSFVFVVVATKISLINLNVTNANVIT